MTQRCSCASLLFVCILTRADPRRSTSQILTLREIPPCNTAAVVQILWKPVTAKINAVKSTLNLPFCGVQRVVLQNRGSMAGSWFCWNCTYFSNCPCIRRLCAIDRKCWSDRMVIAFSYIHRIFGLAGAGFCAGCPSDGRRLRPQVKFRQVLRDWASLVLLRSGPQPTPMQIMIAN